MPGMGGTQRLTRLVGRAKAMDLILTGRMMDATEATLASYGKTAVLAAKEAVDRAEEIGLAEGIRAERRAFHALFATDDQSEGMAAFLEKRPPVFTGR